MTATVTDLFCGAGGSSTGAAAAGMEIAVAANHWETAIEVHQIHHPNARHDVADISAADPRRYPTTDILLASPECTNHSQARGVSRKRQDASLFDQDFDPSAERSRATMWDVVRFAEQINYAAIVVENVVEVRNWRPWPAWLAAMTECLGYRYRILSHNSMHHGVPQSRDRAYIVFTRPGLDVDLDLELDAWCERCERFVIAHQGWKNGKTVGRYRSQYLWICSTCRHEATPPTRPAADIIDWSLPCPRIGDRDKPLATKTRARILAGLERYGWAPITTVGAGNGHERTPGNRARSVGEPLPTQTTTAQSALATPPDSLMVTNDWQNKAIDPSLDALPTATTGNRHALVTPPLVIPLRNNGNAYPASDPLGTVTAGGNHHGLVLRNNSGGAEMLTPTDEPVRTLTTAGHQSLVLPYYTKSLPHPVTQPIGTQTTRDTHAIINVEQLVDDCGFRMLEPYEAAAGMAFPVGYIPRDLPKRTQMKLAGNAVTPPVMQWICGRILQALEVAA